jgi:hypothetical protein
MLDLHALFPFTLLCCSRVASTLTAFERCHQLQGRPALLGMLLRVRTEHRELWGSASRILYRRDPESNGQGSAPQSWPFWGVPKTIL